jgi:DNA replication protein DnaC
MTKLKIGTTQLGQSQRLQSGGQRWSAGATLAGGLLALTLVSSCAGPKYQVNDVVLSDLPMQDKQRMLAVQSEMNQATEEKNKAQSDVAIDDRDISVAEVESAQSRLEAEKLEAELHLAERSQDLNRIRPAKAAFSAKDSAKSLSAAKLNWLTRRRDWHRAQIEVAQLHGTAAERRYELEKARLAQSTGKLPSKNFNVAQFEGQASEAQQKYEQALTAANRQQAEAGQLEMLYSQLAGSRQQG